MSDPRSRHVPHPARYWGRAALLLVPLLWLDWQVYDGWAYGEYTIKPALIFGWLLLPFHLAVLSGALPDALYPSDYSSPPAPHRFLRHWPVIVPGVSYGCVFSAALLAVAASATAVSVVTAGGPKWTVGGVVGMVAAGTGAAVVAGLMLRSRPRLDVDEEGRELVWRPDTLLEAQLTVPFSAVVAVIVVSEVRAKTEQYRLEISWRSNKGRTVATRLPAAATRESVEAVAARLREALGQANAPDGLSTVR